MTTQITTLPNGLRVVTDTNEAVESVAVGTWIGSGARDENLTYNGTAHMVEHMMFKGTQRRNALDIAEVIENVGGHMNAYTSREITSYHIHLLKEDLPLALDVLADIVQHSTMPEDEIERERGVILQEIGMCHDTPDDIIFDKYFETAFPQQTLGAPILGTTDIINAMQRDTLMDFVKTQYTPSNMVICAAGNITHDDFVARVTDAFDALPANQNRAKTTASYAGGEYREERDLEQSHIILGFDAGGHTDPAYYDNRILATILGGGMSSRLFQEIREKRGLVYSIYSFHSAHTDCGQFGIYAGTGAEKLKELMDVLCAELIKIGGTITQAELKRAKAQLRSSTLMGRESMMRRADSNAKDLLLRGEIRSAQDIIDGIDAVSVEKLCTLADTIFTSPPTLAALGPLQQLDTLATIQQKLTGS